MHRASLLVMSWREIALFIKELPEKSLEALLYPSYDRSERRYDKLDFIKVIYLKGSCKVPVLNANMILKDQSYKLFLRAQIRDIVFLDDIEQIDRGQDIV